MARNPYRSLKDKAFWRRSVAMPDTQDVDPVGIFDLKITEDCKVATAGSCFAQHIARYLSNVGFNYFVAEKAHPIVHPKIANAHNYGLFSARYGNIYTSRQLRQLMERALGEFAPVEQPWIDKDGTVRDPFRPTIQPGNFLTESEMYADREYHLQSVLNMFKELDVFVFTMGLTECWRSKVDGAVFPLCPGVDGGVFSPDVYEFYNQSVGDVLEDMDLFLRRLKELNPSAKVVLTVSPVPLMATAEPGASVLSATVYSKSVLRVAAEMLQKKYAFVDYFPSYEIINSHYNRGRYYSEGLRDVTEQGVSHVMGLFLKYATKLVLPAIPEINDQKESVQDQYLARATEVVEVECDETALDPD